MSLIKSENLREIIAGKSYSVAKLVDTAHINQIKMNRLKLTPIIKTVIFCGNYRDDL